MDPLLVAGIGWFVGWWLWGRPRTLPVDPPTATPPAPHLTVIVPARDEAEVLPLLLGDLAADPDPNRSVLVVDDHSDDGTAEVAAAFDGVEVLAAPELPAGWAGKPWACHVGARTLDHGSPDELVAFVDADVRVAPGALRAAADQVARHGGLTSVQPFHTTQRPDEQLSAFCGIVGLLGTGAGRRRGSPWGAFGPLLATRLGDYRSVGGHAAVRDEVAEDVALGLRYRAAGLPVRVWLGGAAVRFRMYPRDLRQLIEGWTKNMATGAGAVPLHRTLLVALWITAAGTAALCLPGVPGNDGVELLAGLAAYGAFVLQVGVLARATGTFGVVTAVLYPVALVAFIGLFLRSAWRLHVRRSVRWRGRTIPLGGARTTG